MTGSTQDAPPLPGSSAGNNPRPARFATTRWSIVLQAGRGNDGPSDTDEALARLCRTYWFPLYAQVRRRGHSPHDAEDLTQGFFAQVLARRSIAQADPARGRFRTFILTALNHYLADEWARRRTAKRGGGHEFLPLDFSSAEQRFAHADPAIGPDQAFDREWALALLDAVLAELEREYLTAGKGDVFAVLKPTLTSGGITPPYAELAARLQASEGAVKVAVHRLRHRYRALLRAEIAETLASPDDAGAELRVLLAALAG